MENMIMTLEERTRLIGRRMEQTVKRNYASAGKIAKMMGRPKYYVEAYLYAGIPRTAALLVEAILALGESPAWVLGLSERRGL